MSANLIVGKDPTGNKVPVAVDAAGQLKIVGGGGGGGSTDMTVANAQLTAINANTDGLEGKADTGNAILTTTAADVATLKDEAVSIDNKLPALSSGRVPVEANNAASQVYNYTATGAVSANTVLIGPIECDRFREVSVQVSALGTSSTMRGEVSNEGTVWQDCPFIAYSSGSSSIGFGGISLVGQAQSFSISGFRYFRVRQNAAQTAGTTTLAAYASQQATPKLHQSVAGTVSVSGSTIVPLASASQGFTSYHTLISAASTNSTSIKVGNGTIGTLILTNTAATWAYFKLVNKASAPTVGTDTAIINIGVAPNSTLDCSTAFAGLRMATGIAYYVSGGTSLTDNTALATAGTFLVNMTYA